MFVDIFHSKPLMSFSVLEVKREDRKSQKLLAHKDVEISLDKL